MSPPRVFILRHGETEWSLNGRHTGTTELPLTANGEKRIKATGSALVGEDRLIVPSKLAHVYVSPRRRAQRSLELLHLGCKEKLPWQEHRTHGDDECRTDAKVQISEDIREWDYGEYEGLTSAQIKEQREQRGEGPWDIWTDGCPGGELPKDIALRLDRLIDEIRSRFHSKVIDKKDGDAACGDVLLVAHGHILRSFAMRWIKKSLSDTSFLLEAGGVGTLRYFTSDFIRKSHTNYGASSYEHNRIEEPAILLGGAFMVEVVENAEVANDKPSGKK
ncbi:MAG: hypothetical protein M1827_001148 [Pycnora praestabilis]|nr:MAG: hypothetical protein M1827_001148 [Pycnora praestabilis]